MAADRTAEAVPSSGRTGERDRRAASLGWRMAWYLLFPVTLVGAYLAVRPLRLLMPIAPYDWQTVAGEAPSLNLWIGDDIVFTSGPLASLYTGYFDEYLLWPKMGLRVLLVVALAWLITSLARQNLRPIAGILFGLGLIVVLGSNDALFLTLPLLTALAVTTSDDARLQLPTFLLGVGASAAFTLAKFNIAPFSVLAFLLVDVLRVYYRRAPVHLITYLAATFVLFAIFDRPENYLAYVFGSVSVAAGYSEAMFLDGQMWEIVAFLATATFVFAVIAFSELRAVQLRILPLPMALLRLILLAAFLFMVWKEGFVRHDAHSLIAWTGLGLSALTYATIAPHTGRKGWRGDLPVEMFSILVGFVALYLVVPALLANYMREPLSAAPNFVLKEFPWRLNEVKAFREGPSTWAAKNSKRKQGHFEYVAKQRPLPKLDGSVDALPNLQTGIIAHGLTYRPRPSFQQYGTYTGMLIDLNRRSIVERGPDYLLFGTDTMDERYPAMTEGAWWPEIIQLYATQAMDGDLLILKRRAKPLPGPMLGPEVKYRTKFGKPVPIPDTPAPQFLTASISKTWLGELATLLWRPAAVKMRVTFASGQEQSYRIIPAIGQAGFLITPLVQSASDFLPLVEGRGGSVTDPARRAKQVVFDTSELGAWQYRPKISVTFRALNAREGPVDETGTIGGDVKSTP